MNIFLKLLIRYVIGTFIQVLDALPSSVDISSRLLSIVLVH